MNIIYQLDHQVQRTAVHSVRRIETRYARISGDKSACPRYPWILILDELQFPCRPMTKAVSIEVSEKLI